MFVRMAVSEKGSIGCDGSVAGFVTHLCVFIQRYAQWISRDGDEDVFEVTGLTDLDIDCLRSTGLVFRVVDPSIPNSAYNETMF